MVLQAVFLLAQAVGVAVALALTCAAIYLWNEHRKYAHIPGPKRSRYVIYISIFYSKVTEDNSVFSIVVHRWVWPARRCHSLIVSATQEKHLSVSASQLALYDVMKLKHFPRYWPFVWGIHRSPVNSPHKGQWRGALMFSLICVWINGWANNREAGDLRRHRAHYDVIVMLTKRDHGSGSNGPLWHVLRASSVCVSTCELALGAPKCLAKHISQSAKFHIDNIVHSIIPNLSNYP